MLTIRKKFAIVLTIIFILSFISFNLFMDKFFNKRFEATVSADMLDNYKISSKILNDYISINNLEKDDLVNKNTINKTLNFIVERVYCYGILFDIDGNILSTALTNDGEIDIKLLTQLPTSFSLAKNNKTVLDIETTDNSIYGKLSYCIYGTNNEPLCILVLVKDYTSTFKGNTTTKNLTNLIVGILFIVIFIVIYFLLSTIVKPIIKLKDKVSEIASGKYPKKLSVSSKDEVGVLINSFNSMSEKLRLKDEQEKSIFRNITHELKTPLASISGYAQILRDNNFNNKDFSKKAIDRIISESNRMHELIITLLNISKQSSDLEEFTYEEVNLKLIIEDILATQLPKIAEKELTILKDCENAIVKGNKQYLTILYSNLIVNGVKYSFNKSNMVISLIKAKDSTIFSITTEGKEIPVEMTERIFEPFIKVEKDGFASKASQGLGLYICKNIINTHNGTIKVNVNKNFTEFIATIPNFYNLETS